MERKLSSIILHILFCFILMSCGSGGGSISSGGSDDNNTSNKVTSRVSVDSNGNQTTTNSSSSPSISSDGRYVAFESLATDLVAGDTNGLRDVFVHDRDTGSTMRVSVDSNGNQATGGNSSAPSISPGGKFVAFESDATNLVTADTNGLRDIFVHDRNTGTTIRVSVNSSGNQATGGSSFAPSISPDGRFVSFESLASNLVTADTNGLRDVFVHDRDTDNDGIFDEPSSIATSRVSVNSSGNQATTGSSSAPSISSDGRFVTFESPASDIVTADINGLTDIFVHDRNTGATTRISVDISGGDANGTGSSAPSISSDGRYVAFESDASDLVAGDTNGLTDIFVRDRNTGTTIRVSVNSNGTQAATGSSSAPSISSDGRYVSFESVATDLVAGDTNGLRDVFVHDRDTDNDGIFDEPGLISTSRVSVDSNGNQATSGSSSAPSISSDSKFIAFESAASDLVANDTNGLNDIFVRER